jgi:hypothetical protein
MRVIVCMPTTSNNGVCFGGQFWKLITKGWLTQDLYSNWGLVHWLPCPALSTSVRYMVNFSDWFLWHKFTGGILDLSIDMQDTWSLLDCARNELGSVRTFLVSKFAVFFYVTFLCWSFSNSFGGKQAVLRYDFSVEGKPQNCLDDAIVPMRLVLHRLEHGLEGYDITQSKRVSCDFSRKAQKPSRFLTFRVSCSCSFFYFFVGVFSQGMLDIRMGLRSPEFFLDSYWLNISAS